MNKIAWFCFAGQNDSRTRIHCFMISIMTLTAASAFCISATDIVIYNYLQSIIDLPRALIVLNVKYAYALFAMICNRLVLWLRIFAVFYQNRIIQQNINKCFVYGHMLLLPLLLGYLTITVIIVVQYSNVSSTWSETFLLPLLILGVILKPVIDLGLLISFTIPLCLHRRHMIKRGLCGNNSIKQVIKRVTHVQMMCFLSDYLPILIVYFLRSFAFVMITLNCNSLINTVGIILSFADWREKLFPYKLN